jgi:hypothetical protein
MYAAIQESYIPRWSRNSIKLYCEYRQVCDPDIHLTCCFSLRLYRLLLLLRQWIRW